MGEININGWWDETRTNLMLSAGDNDDVVAAENMVVIAPEAGCRITGLIPPLNTQTWLCRISNGGPDDIVFPNNDSGSTEGYRTLMPPGFTSYTLALGQTATFVYTYNADNPAITGWYPLIPGTINPA